MAGSVPGAGKQQGPGLGQSRGENSQPANDHVCAKEDGARLEVFGGRRQNLGPTLRPKRWVGAGGIRGPGEG